MTNEHFEMLALAKKYVDETIAGIGALKGKNCTITNTEESEDTIAVTFHWLDDLNEEQQTVIHIFKGNKNIYSQNEKLIGEWIDGKKLYRKVVTITDGLAKDNLIKVCDVPEGMIEMIKCWGMIKTTQGSFSNNDILVYCATDGVYTKQNFTSYIEKLTIIIEYTK